MKDQNIADHILEMAGHGAILWLYIAKIRSPMLNAANYFLGLDDFKVLINLYFSGLFRTSLFFNECKFC